MEHPIPRILGEYTSDTPGPLLFVTAGVHGNEPSGVVALQRVFDELKKGKPEVKGRLVGIAGNRKALEKNVRFIDEDLNRVWSPENLDQEVPKSHEQKEMGQIVGALNSYLKHHDGPYYFLDCHTTSSESLPYISVQEVNDNDTWAHRFPAYIVRGFSDLIQGDIDHYLSRIGLTGFVFEAGQHESEHAVDNHEGMIWMALKEALGLDLEAISRYPECVKTFKEATPLQKTFEIVHRHGLQEDDTFQMEPGFENFDAIDNDQLLAHHNGKEIRSEWDGHIFMPLYQAKGNDGFFVIKGV